MKIVDNIVLSNSSLSVGDKKVLDSSGRALGGFRSVDTLADMYQLPEDRRELGMQVYVQANGTLYILNNNRVGLVTVASDWSVTNAHVGFAQEAIDLLTELNPLT